MTTTSYDYNLLERYAFADPAGSSRNTGTSSAKLKRIKARQAIVCIAADHIPRIFVLSAWAGRLTTSKFRDKIISVYDQFRPRWFGVESNAMQFLFADLVREEGKRVFGTRVKLTPFNQPTNIIKDRRIEMTLEPVINDGRLFLLPGMTHVETELRGFPTAQWKDIVDALASCVRQIPKRQYKEKADSEMEALATYLRNSKLPPHLIEARLAAVRAERAAAVV